MSVGTTENVAGSGSTGNVTSGTASEAMIKAATAASSADTPAPGASGNGATATGAGDGTPGSTTGATGQPAGAGSPGAAGERGPIPYDRHEAALANARKDEAQKFAWAAELQGAGLKPEEVKAGVDLLMRLRKDPAAFWKQLGEEGKFGSAAGSTEPTFEYPEADLSSPDGTVKAYSQAAFLKALEVQEQKLLHTFKKEMQPLVEFQTSEMTARERAAFNEQVAKASNSAYKRAEALPHFKEHKAAIAEKLAATSLEVLEEIGPIAAMFEAYHAVLAEKVYPTIGKSAEEKVREDFQRKAAGGGGVHPGGGGGNHKAVKLENVNDLAAHMERLAAQQSTS